MGSQSELIFYVVYNNSKILEDGWTVVTLDGKPSAHFEHCVAITKDGPEILTQI